jgi:hypothetical protein
MRRRAHTRRRTRHDYQRLSKLSLNVRPSGLADAELKPEDGEVPVM